MADATTSAPAAGALLLPLGVACVALLAVACVPGALDFPPSPQPLAAGGVAVLATEREVETRENGRVRLALVGDVGSWRGLEVAQRVGWACAGAAPPGCDLTLLLGDNLYPEGLRGSARERAAQRARLAELTAPLPPPVVAALGNHDWGYRFPRLAIARRQLEWFAETQGGRGGAHFYRFRAGPVEVWVLETNYLVWRPHAARSPALRDWLEEIERSGARWKLVVGHHPYLSAGKHGSAGRYEDGPFRLWPGAALRELLEELVIGRVDLYAAGHDHNLQLFVGLGESARTAAAVVGSGSRCEPPPKAPRPEPAFEHYDLGFALLEADRERLALTFFDGDGERLAVASSRGHRWQVEALASEPRRSCPPGTLPGDGP